MKRYLLFLVVFFTAMLFAASARADSVHKGRVMSAGNGQITFMDEMNEMKSFAVGSDATVVHDGKPAKLEEIDGDIAEVTVKMVYGKKFVISIHARSMGRG